MKTRGQTIKGAATELLLPLQEDVGKALDAFGKANGITMIIDGTQVPIVYAADTIDITKAFIADYNRKNPATRVTPPTHFRRFSMTVHAMS